MWCMMHSSMWSDTWRLIAQNVTKAQLFLLCGAKFVSALSAKATEGSLQVTSTGRWSSRPGFIKERGAQNFWNIHPCTVEHFLAFTHILAQSWQICSRKTAFGDKNRSSNVVCMVCATSSTVEVGADVSLQASPLCWISDVWDLSVGGGKVGEGEVGNA